MAKIGAGDVPRFLGGAWKAYAIVLVYGSDEGAIRETVDRLAATAAGPDPDPLNLIDLDGEALAQDPPRLADEMKAFGLFGGFRVIRVRNAGRAPLAAIETIADSGAELLLYSVNAITTGTDAQGEVTVRLSKDGRVVNGQGADTDIIVASAKAYLNALNKLQGSTERLNPQV